MTRCCPVLLLCAVALAACESTYERETRQAAEDDASCRSYGAVKGTDAYVNCRVELEKARRTSAAGPPHLSTGVIFGRRY